jgi:hypothetical protein
VRWPAYDEPRDGTPPGVRFAFIDPAASAYPALDEVEKHEAPASALSTTFELATNFIESSRRRELLAPRGGQRYDDGAADDARCEGRLSGGMAGSSRRQALRE